MKIREYDPLLYRQLLLCLEGDYVSAAGDALTPAMQLGLQRSLKEAHVGEACRCLQRDCRSFRVRNAKPTPASRRVRFHVHGELAVVCEPDGTLQMVEWLPEPPAAPRRCYEITPEFAAKRDICPFPN